jgi:hypothetical protein
MTETQLIQGERRQNIHCPIYGISNTSEPEAVQECSGKILDIF